jgi:hypothetical protein
MPCCIADVDITATIQKNTDDVWTSELGRPVDWLSSGEVSCVKRRPGLDQRLRNFGIWRPEKWCVAALPRAIDIGAGFEKESNQVEIFGLDRHMQRSASHMTCRFSRIGLASEYPLQAFDVGMARSSQDFGPAVETIVERVVRGLFCPEV